MTKEEKIFSDFWRQPIKLLSLDLDNTIVNRDLGSNFVYDRTISLIKEILKEGKIKLIINTGRDQIGFESFCESNELISDAVLGSGSIIVSSNNVVFNDKSKLPTSLVSLLIDGVKEKKISFIDITSFNNRCIVTNDNLSSDLYFSQNPCDWFRQFPPIYQSSSHPQLENVFRVEFPISQSSNKSQSLFECLKNKQPNCLQELFSFLGKKPKGLNPCDYVLKRKAFFKHEYKEKVQFARLEVADKIANKGTGLRMWIDFLGFNLDKTSIIHLGDRDRGIVNDFMVKSEIAHSHLVLINDKDCDLNNADLVLTGEVDQAVYDLLNKLNNCGAKHV